MGSSRRNSNGELIKHRAPVPLSTNSNHKKKELSGGVPTVAAVGTSRRCSITNDNNNNDNDEYLPLMMLNPPISLFEVENDRIYQCNTKNNLNSVNPNAKVNTIDKENIGNHLIIK